MNTRSEIKFSSYDRLFPSQDTMPKGGFGNLIALPFQGKARKNGNSVFVNDEFVAHQDQWSYLSNIKKMSLSAIETKAKELCKNSDLGKLIVADESGKEPWEKIAYSVAISKKDLPKAPVVIIKSNMIYIEKDSISSQLRNKIKRLASFKNPDFYKAQAMRMSTYNKSRVISLSEENAKYIAIPRGALKALSDFFDSMAIKYVMEDKTNTGNKIDVDFNGQLRENQIPAVEAIIKHDIGVLSATTAFGKTVVAANIIAQRKTNTLILVHTQSLLNQWRKSLSEFLLINHALPGLPKKRGRKKEQCIIGQLGCGKNDVNNIIDIAIMQSLVKGDEIKEIVRNYGQIIVDECHHISAVSFEKIMKYANAKYVLGLTATPIRQDGHHPIVFLQCGDVRYKVDAKSEAMKRSFEHFVVPRFTSFKKVSLQDENSISKIYIDIMLNDARNELIVEDVKKALSENRSPLILTERIEHIKIFENLLSEFVENVIMLSGNMSVKERKLASEKLNMINGDDKFLIIATGKYIGEGFDFPRLDTLFLAMPIAWKGKVAQYAGRLHRNYSGKEEVVIYDYIDVHVPVLERMYHKRVKGYKDIGYRAKDIGVAMPKNSIIYDDKSFATIFCSDIASAKKEIVIFSPFLRKARVSQMIRNLSVPMINNVKITVVTRSPDDFKESDKAAVIENCNCLTEAGVRVVHKSKIHQKFAVLDNITVWYGSINLLSYCNSEESIMRLESAEIANELYDLI